MIFSLQHVAFSLSLSLVIVLLPTIYYTRAGLSYVCNIYAYQVHNYIREHTAVSKFDHTFVHSMMIHSIRYRSNETHDIPNEKFQPPAVVFA